MSSAFICTEETPWTPDKGTPARHLHVEEIGDQECGWPAGDIIAMRCKICGVEWKEELPQ